MKLKNTLILLVIFIILGAYVYFVEIKKHRKDEQVEKESKKVFTLVKDSINTLIFKNLSQEFSLKKEQNEWKITHPLETEADNSTINSMLTSLINAEKDKVFNVMPKDLFQFGLDKRSTVIQVSVTTGESDSIRIGDDTPVGSYVFAYKKDSTVFTINRSVKNSFNKKLFDIRDRQLLHFIRTDVRYLSLMRESGKIEFEKSEGSDWIIPSINRPADNSKISSILSKLENNKAKAFVDEQGTQLKKYGLHKPTYQVELLLGPEKGQKRLFISNSLNGKYYAKDETRKPIFEIDSALVKDIKQKLTDFRSKDFASFDRNEVNRIVVQYGDTLFTCLKDSANIWYLDDSTHQMVKSSEITSFFSSLDYTNISDFVKDENFDVKRYGLDKPSLKLSLYKDDELLIEATLGNEKENKIYAITNQINSLYLIPSSKLEDLKLKLDNIIEAPEEAESEEEIS